MNLEDLTLENFSGRVGEAFRLGDTTLVLEEAARVGDEPPTGRRGQFSLIFRAPPGPALPQRIYPLDHPDLGRTEIFLVPISSDANGVRYQAVFT